MPQVETFDLEEWDDAEEQFYEENERPSIELYRVDEDTYVACEPFTRYDEPFIKSDYII